MAAFNPQFRRILKRLDWSDWVIWFGVGAWAASQFLERGNPVMALLAIVLLTSGSLKLAAHRWSWHVILTTWIVFLTLNIAGLLLQDRSAFQMLILVGAAWGLWSHWREREQFRILCDPELTDETDEKPDTKPSLVLWLREPIYLDSTILAQIATRAFGVPFSEGEESENFVVGDGPYVLKFNGSLFFLQSWERNYFDAPNTAAEELKELRRAEAVRSHRAWISMDFMQPENSTSEDQIYVIIGRMLAELVHSKADVLAVFHPVTGRIEPWESELSEKLASERPLSVFEKPSNVPVIQVDSKSPEMVAAVHEARRRWPEFIAAYQSAVDKEPFAVKAPITETGRTEFIWINVKSIANGQIHGFLANDPVALGDLKIGSFVSVAETELNDWICPDPADPNRPLGLFTVNAVQAASKN